MEAVIVLVWLLLSWAAMGLFGFVGFGGYIASVLITGIIIVIIAAIVSLQIMAHGRRNGKAYQGDWNYPGGDSYSPPPSVDTSGYDAPVHETPSQFHPSSSQEFYLRDNCGRPIGIIKNVGNTRHVCTTTGRVLGWYNIASNTTHDITGRVIGYGDLTSTLL
jgi:hypothetical protein